MPARSLFGALVLALLVLGRAPSATFALPLHAPYAQGTAACEATSLSVALLGALDTLRTWLGASVGEPINCAELAGDEVIQHTTTGAAFYDPRADEATFTDGHQRWSAGPQGRRFWRSPDAVGQPVDSPPFVRSVRCPVLYAHEVGSQASLRSLLAALGAAGYRPTSIAAVDRAMAATADVPPGCLVLTFDDALYSQYVNALPVLASLRVPAVFFVMPGFADGVHRYMGVSEIRALQQLGHEVGSHTCNHPSLPRLRVARPEAFLAEVQDCRRTLEGMLGVPVAYFAYPHGAFDAGVANAVAVAGYRAAFTTRAASLLSPASAFALPRIRIDIGEPPATIIERIRAAV